RVEHLEERARWERLELDPPSLEPLEQFVFLRAAQLVEALPVGTLTMVIGLGDARTVELLRREGELVALLRRALAPGPLAIVLAHGAERSGELAIDEGRNASFTGAGSEAVRWNEARHRRFDERRLGPHEECVRVAGRCSARAFRPSRHHRLLRRGRPRRHDRALPARPAPAGPRHR